VDGFLAGGPGSIDEKLGLERRFVGIIDTREVLHDAFACFGVEPLHVSLLAHLQGGSHVHLDESAPFGDNGTSVVPRLSVWSNGSDDGETSGVGDLGGDPGNALDVEVAMLLGEAELGGEVDADVVAVEEGDGAGALLHEGDAEGVGHRRFPGAGEPGEEHGEPLLMPRRVCLPQDFHH